MNTSMRSYLGAVGQAMQGAVGAPQHLLGGFGGPAVGGGLKLPPLDPGVLGGILNNIRNGGGDPTILTNPLPADPSKTPVSAFADVERAMRLDPIGTLGRNFRCYWLGATISGGVARFTPQKDIILLRLFTRQAEAAGTLSQPIVGVTPLALNSSAISAGLFGPLGRVNFMPPVVCKVGQQITMSTSGITRLGALVADIDEETPMQTPLQSYLQPIGFNSGSIANGATFSIEVKPQVDMRLRAVQFDFAGAAPGDTIITSINVGNKPQFESGDPIPVDCLLDTLQTGAFMDGDLCKVGNSIFINGTNSSGGALTYVGACWGDTR